VKFRSKATTALSFEIAGGHYDVPAGGLVEIEDKWSYAPAASGLPLEPASDAEVGPVARAVYRKARPIRMPDGVELTDAPPVVEEEDDSDPVDPIEDLAPDVKAALGKGKGKKK
jgi:hypothetical protein